jgi:hypothetical protein
VVHHSSALFEIKRHSIGGLQPYEESHGGANQIGFGKC